MATYYEMDPREVAWGWVPGLVDDPTDGDADVGEGPVEALERIVLEALQHPPCFVEFSGGRDSSALLAVAVQAARRAGLADPIPVTWVYPTVPEAQEDEWQQKVIRHLRLDTWERHEILDESDLVGPTATDSLRRRGLLWPPTLHTRSVTWRHCRGGSVINGNGGDEILGIRRSTPLAGLLARNVRPRRRATVQAAKSMLPKAVRRRIVATELWRSGDRRWLRPAARRRYVDAIAADAAEEPFAWSASVLHHLRLRSSRLGTHNLRTEAAAHGVAFVQPFLDPRFVRALAHAGTRFGYPGRTAAMKALFGDLLPDDVIRRTSKADFTRVYFGDHTRRFVDRWTGEGVDPELVDVERLREVWRSERPHAGTAALLQQAWLKANE